jgi:hypothetical protein
MTASITKIKIIIDGVRVSLMKSGPDRWQWRTSDGIAYSPEFTQEDRAINYPNVVKMKPL